MTITNFKPIPLREFAPGTAAAPFRRDELAQTSYRPTIVIGVGGTGLAVVRRLKKLLRRYYRGHELEIFQFRVFDTTSEEVPEGEQPLDAGEFIAFPAFDAAKLITYLHENEHIARWWPGGLERPYRPAFSGTGANRVRAVGRLVLYNYMTSMVIDKIETAIDRAIEINAQHGMGATSIKIYIVCSLAGGTGSGMALDLAYVARMKALDRQPTAFVTGVLVLDDAFLPKAQTANTAAEFSANTYAALRELNHFSGARRFVERYDDLTSTEAVPDGMAPFDMAYLLGLHNSEGQALESFESLADMIAAEMMLEIASPLQGCAANRLDNVRSNENAVAGQPAAFSSFALSSLVYPLSGIASWCALRGHAEFSSRVLLTPRRPAGELEADVLAFMQKAIVEEAQADLLIDRLNKDDRGAEMATPSLSFDQVDGLPEAQLLGGLQRLEESALGCLAEVREAIAANVPTVQKQFAREVRAEAEVALRDPQRGPRYAAWLLTKLAERLAAARDDEMSAEQARYRAEADANGAAWRAAKEALLRTLHLPRILPWRGGSIRKARAAYTAAFNAYLHAEHELERRTQAIPCFEAFVNETRDLARRVNDLVNEWIALSEAVQARAEAEPVKDRATDTEYSLMRNIVGREELTRTFERHFPEIGEAAEADHLASKFWQFFSERAPDWTLPAGSPANPHEGSPAIQVYYFLAEMYADRLAGKSLVERLKEIYGDAWEHEIELRYRQTAPFWNYNLARFGDRIRNNLQNEPRIVGYGENDVDGWSRAVGRAVGEHLDAVNNKNPHEMLFLKTSHGLPLFALRSVNQNMRTKYEYIKRMWDNRQPGTNPIPLHISRLWEPILPDIDPVPAPSGPADGAPGATQAVGVNGHSAAGAARQELPYGGQTRGVDDGAQT